jgi:hypothetical protein
MCWRGLNSLEYHVLASARIIKEFLNNRPTRQKRALILRADAERIADTLFDHSHTIS